MPDHQSKMYELAFPSPDVSDGKNGGPALVVALQGYADAGQAVEGSASHLLDSLDHRLIASFDNDELIDYRSRRPTIMLDSGELTQMEQLELGLHVVRDSAHKPFLLLTGPEPDLRWEAFSQAVADLAERFGVDQTICLYAAPMAVPHTRPLMVTAHGTNRTEDEKALTFDARVTAPGSAALKLESVLLERGKNVKGYTAHVPHYLAASEYPEATLRLLESVANSAHIDLPLGALTQDAERVNAQLAEQVDGSPEIQHVVRILEEQYDEELANFREKHPKALLPGEQPIPSGEELGEEFERFLADLDKHPGAGNTPNSGTGFATQLGGSLSTDRGEREETDDAAATNGGTNNPAHGTKPEPDDAPRHGSAQDPEHGPAHGADPDEGEDAE